MQKNGNKKTMQPNQGFAMLFTVLLISLVLSIALGISNIAFKQTILSSLAKDSQIAFYQADAGAECGLYYDFTVNAPLGAFPEGSTYGYAQSNFPELTCGEETLELQPPPLSSADYFVYQCEATSSLAPCFNIIFDKTGSENMIRSFGYNIYDESHPRQVERALEVRY